MKKNIVLEAELQQSRIAMEAELNLKFDCYRQIFIDADSTYNSSQPKGQSQLFYRDFLKLKNKRDSIVNIKTSLSKKEWMVILLQFSKQATDLRGAEGSKKEIEMNLKFLNDNFNSIQESEFGELYKHIIERWTKLTYESEISNVAIDFRKGQRPPCRL